MTAVKLPNDTNSFLCTLATISGGLADASDIGSGYYGFAREKQSEHGYGLYADYLAQFAANIENAYETVNEQFDGCFMELLQDKNVCFCFDLELVPMIMDKAFNLKQLVLNEAVIKEYLLSLLKEN